MSGGPRSPSGSRRSSRRRHPFALRPALDAIEDAIAVSGNVPQSEEEIDALRPPFRALFAGRLDEALRPATSAGTAVLIPDTTPRVDASRRLREAREELLDACDGFLRREAIAASLTPTSGARSCAAWSSPARPTTG